MVFYPETRFAECGQDNAYQASLREFVQQQSPYKANAQDFQLAQKPKKNAVDSYMPLFAGAALLGFLLLK